MSASAANSWFLDSTPGERFPAWTRGNAADVFPDPFSPLGQTMVIRQAMCLGLRDAYISLGALDWEEFEHPEAPDLFHMYGGYLYNPLSLTRLLGARMPGASPEAIDKAEDRSKFKDAMTKIGLGSARSGVAHSMEESWAVQRELGFPTIIRPSFTMGGTGGGIAYNEEEFETICKRGLEASPTKELLIEESLIGWKEYEMEVVRDKADN
eukprot:gene33000-55566_t